MGELNGRIGQFVYGHCVGPVRGAVCTALISIRESRHDKESGRLRRCFVGLNGRFLERGFRIHRPNFRVRSLLSISAIVLAICAGPPDVYANDNLLLDRRELKALIVGKVIEIPNTHPIREYFNSDGTWIRSSRASFHGYYEIKNGGICRRLRTAAEECLYLFRSKDGLIQASFFRSGEKSFPVIIK